MIPTMPSPEQIVLVRHPRRVAFCGLLIEQYGVQNLRPVSFGWKIAARDRQSGKGIDTGIRQRDAAGALVGDNPHISFS